MNKNNLAESENTLGSRYNKLEMEHIRAFLKEKGYILEDLHQLPAVQAKELMSQACQHASAMLAEIEARARFRQEIHRPPS
jgi:hypothetical protein